MANISKRQLDELRRIHAKLSELLADFGETAVEVAPEVAELMQKRLADRICLACGLPIPADVVSKRGQHPGCYSTTRARINRGDTTEEIEISLGKLTPERKKAGRPAKQDRLSPESQAKIDQLEKERIERLAKSREKHAKKKKGE